MGRKLQSVGKRAWSKQFIVRKVFTLVFICTVLLSVWFYLPFVHGESGYLLSSILVTDKNQLCHLNLDAILVLGGGVPLDEDTPPPWVQARAKLAAEIYHCQNKKPFIVTLSGGSAHVQNKMRKNGLPLWESANTATFLVDQCDVPADRIVFETSSYDTIGNAYFVRTSVTDVRSWGKLLIITSQTHLTRSKAIFDWVFKLDRQESEKISKLYTLSYFGTEDVGLTEEGIFLRKEREAKSLQNIHKLSRSINSLSNLHEWLSTQHSLYAAKYISAPSEKVPEGLKRSYGGS